MILCDIYGITLDLLYIYLYIYNNLFRNLYVI